MHQPGGGEGESQRCHRQHVLPDSGEGESGNRGQPPRSGRRAAESKKRPTEETKHAEPGEKDEGAALVQQCLLLGKADDEEEQEEQGEGERNSRPWDKGPVL
jgi:hypothetical protein